MDQRRSRRRQVRVFVDLVGPEGNRCEYATTLGSGGLFIETEAPLPPSTSLTVQFRLPGGTRVHELAGTVVRVEASEPDAPGSRPPGMGIQFGDPESIRRLADELEDLP